MGDLPGGIFQSVAYSASADGAIDAGLSHGASGNEAFIWDATNGMRSLRDVLVNDHGLNLTGWTLTRANGISADGLTIVGSGTNPSGVTEAWIATLGPPVTDCNANGIPDATDIANMTSLDRDTDECEPDFDGDGLIDDCDDDDDNDGVLDVDDVCPFMPLGLTVRADGRPKGDMNDDCLVNGLDIQLFVQQVLNP